MFEKIFAFCWRIYPAAFREQYSEQALQLVRDRSQAERGFIRRLRLCMDLVIDLVISLAREYRYARSAWPTAIAQGRGVPGFCLLEGEAPRVGSMFAGGVLSLLALACFPALMNHFGYYRPSAAWTEAFARATEGASLAQRPESQPSRPAAQKQAPSEADTKLDEETRHRIVLNTIAAYKEHATDTAAAQAASDALLEHESRGDDRAAGTPTDLARLLTAQLREATGDNDVEMMYRTRPIPERQPGPPPPLPAAYRDQMQRINCAFEKVDLLPGNIGYIKVNGFGHPSVCGQIANDAMERVNGATAIIFDVRENRGGFDLGSTMAAYLFDHPEYWYSPIQSTTRESWTHSPVAGSKLADKPVFVLTSSRTISAAEQFCYNLKMLRRATLIGETTAGGAHAASFHSIGDNFYLGTADANSINPYSKHDWNVTGIEPDVKVKADEALDTALHLARSKSTRK